MTHSWSTSDASGASKLAAESALNSYLSKYVQTPPPALAAILADYPEFADEAHLTFSLIEMGQTSASLRNRQSRINSVGERKAGIIERMPLVLRHRFLANKVT
jgi:hypothetical protein